MKYEEIRVIPGSYEIELGKHDRVTSGRDENGRFYSVSIHYEKPDRPGDAHTAWSSRVLFENEEIRLAGHFSTHKEFDGKLLGLLVIRKPGHT